MELGFRDFNVHPEHITSSLGVSPTKAWRRGEARPHKGNYTFSAWYLEQKMIISENGFEVDIDSEIKRILSVVPNKGELRRVALDFGGFMSIVIFCSDAYYGHTINPKTLQVLSDLNLVLDIHMYHASQD